MERLYEGGIVKRDPAMVLIDMQDEINELIGIRLRQIHASPPVESLHFALNLAPTMNESAANDP